MTTISEFDTETQCLDRHALPGIQLPQWPGSAIARWGNPRPGPPFFAAMFLLYADASGSAELSDVNTRHYVLIGLAVHEGTWFALDKRLNGLKSAYCQPGEDFELHAAEFACTIKEQDDVSGFAAMSWTDRRAAVNALRKAKLAALPPGAPKSNREKNYKRTESFIHLTRQERSRLLEDALDLVGQHRGITLFGEAILKTHPTVSGGHIDPTLQGFAQVVSRFDAFLKRRDDWKLKRSPRRKIDNGLLVLDQDYSTESSIVNQFKDYRRRGHPWGKLVHVIDVPFFAESYRVCGLQLVDICAYAVRRYLDKNATPGGHEERNFQRIFGRFDRDSLGKLHGLRHYVPVGSCACMICRERGHATNP